MLTIKRSIYNKKTRFLIIDIETCKQDNSIIFDLSFGIYSRSEGLIGRVGYIVSENKDSIPYYSDRLKRYDDYLQEGSYHIKSFKDIINILSRMITKYELSYVTAYNSGFDMSRIDSYCNKQGIDNPLNGLIELDLYHMSAQTLGRQKSFKKFIEANNFYTPKGNRSSGAETMYRYIELEPMLQEEHTGYGDILWEANILNRVLRQKQKMDCSRNSQSWRIVQG